MNSKVKYLVRLDDACPTMDRSKWGKIEAILDKYNIKPMVGIIPANNDTTLKIDEVDNFFWEKAFRWHQNYSLLYTQVLGKLACLVTSRSWVSVLQKEIGNR